MAKDIKAVLLKYRIPIICIALVIAIIVTTVCLIADSKAKKKNENIQSSVPSPVIESSSEDTSSEPIQSEEPISSEEPPVSETPASSVPPVSSIAPVPAQPYTPTLVPGVDFGYNTNLDIENNVFMDSLIYTGYNITKHRNDGNMWKYLLWTDKEWRGYLSGITYGGGCTGYETDAYGKPDIARFRRGGLVCASFVTYVYFNYLPNVAGMDTSSLIKPNDPHLAHDWYVAVKNWVAYGMATEIPFYAKLNGKMITFTEQASMPIGSVVIFCDGVHRSDHGSHVAIYAGYKNGYHWLFHVGNKNGPEFCAIERMYCGPDPQWPLYIVTPPKCLPLGQ